MTSNESVLVERMFEHMEGVDTIGFYPYAWREFDSVWTGIGKCPACGHVFTAMEELFDTSCLECNSSFID